MPQIVRIVKVFYEKIEKGFDKITKNRYNISCTTMEQGIIMLLGLSKIMQKPDSVLPFHTALDLHALQFGGSFPVQEPVSAEGTVRNTAEYEAAVERIFRDERLAEPRRARFR